MSSLNIVFGGTPKFAVPALEALLTAGHKISAVYTQPDRPAGRGQHLAISAIKECALRYGLVIEQPKTLREPAAIERLTQYRPDVMIVVAYGLLLPAEILAIPRLGCINIHASLLPRWRGAAPIQRALLAGDAESGISIMLMEAGLDTGPVLSFHKTPVDARETASTLHDRLAILGAAALIETLEKYVAQQLLPIAQSTQGVTYAHKIKKEEAALQWQRPAVELDAQVRAFNPWPIAETRWNGQQLRIWEAVPFAAFSEVAPGTVIRADQNGIVVATGAGTLNLLRVQLAGRKAVSAAEFLNAHHIIDCVLGD